jgi:CheY-like chemotaxis protein
MAARILVIEDNPANLELMSYLLKASGYQVLAARDGASGLDLVSREHPDLVICDIQIPCLDGFVVAGRLKQDPELRSIPLVAVTAFAMVGDRDRMLAMGFDEYLAKPINPRTFSAQVEAVLHGSVIRSRRQDPMEP